jgi:hypothetical protein
MSGKFVTIQRSLRSQSLGVQDTGRGFFKRSALKSETQRKKKTQRRKEEEEEEEDTVRWTPKPCPVFEVHLKFFFSSLRLCAFFFLCVSLFKVKVDPKV